MPKKINGTELMSDFNYVSKYAKHDKTLNRRELWNESIDRMMNMHLRKYEGKGEEVVNEIKWAFDMVKQKRILASQRAMQFAGPAIENKNMRIYNCATTHLDRVRAFSESFYMLLCGCGIGYSVQQRHVSRLPKLIDMDKLTHDVQPYIVEDSIEGWCDVAHAIISSFFEGNEHSGIRYEVDYSQIRQAGAPLSHGGKAPGPKGLIRSIEMIREVLLGRIKKGRKTCRSIDVYDILCHLSDAVLSGGVRRSASICLFDIEDELMLNSKTGNWFADNPQRARSNNSAVVIKGTITRDKFHLMIDTIKQFGEPGFIFLDHPDFLYNPCLDGDTLVTTDKGEMKIRDIVNSDEEIRVLSYNEKTQETEWDSVKAGVKTRENTEAIRIDFDDGTFLELTPDHRVFTENRGYVCASDLREDDEVVSIEETDSKSEVQYEKEVEITINNYIDQSKWTNRVIEQPVIEFE